MHYHVTVGVGDTQHYIFHCRRWKVCCRLNNFISHWKKSLSRYTLQQFLFTGSQFKNTYWACERFPNLSKHNSTHYEGSAVGTICAALVNLLPSVIPMEWFTLFKYSSSSTTRTSKGMYVPPVTHAVCAIIKSVPRVSYRCSDGNGQIWSSRSFILDGLSIHYNPKVCCVYS